MCGIAGVFGLNDSQCVQQMLNMLIHRGPDDGHIVSGDDFAIGARRLSIVGVADGRQPLTNETGTIWAAQNGELYNYPQTRRLLLARGHKLRTNCDTEILPHLYEEYGASLVEKIDGMFAVCLWDKNAKKGFLFRDRMGKKPLYYFQQGSHIYFASEVKALLRVPGFKRQINYEALSYFLSFKHVPAPLSIFENIKVLQPAHMLKFENGEIKIERYWDLSFSPNPLFEQASEEELVDELLARFKAAVQRRLMSDVPIGFFLSGGIDSSLTTAIAAEICKEPIKTFTLTYEDTSGTEGKESDKKWAAWTANKFKTEHHEESIEFNRFPDTLRKVIACFDEPFAGTSSTYFLSSLIARHVKVAVSGDGADELFGSYLSHRLAEPLSRFEEYLRTGDKSLISPFENQEGLLAELYASDDWCWRAKLLVYSDKEKDLLFADDARELMSRFSAEKRVELDFQALTAADPLNRVLEAEYKSIFPDQVLAFVDRLSMAHSLEIRSAFLDTQLVQFVAGLPEKYKIRKGETKYLLKKAASRYLPQEMVYRKKEGFLLPITEWLTGELNCYVRETLSPARLSRHGVFDKSHVSGLVENLSAGNCHYTQVNKVFALVVFQEWFELYMASSSLEAPAEKSSNYNSDSSIYPVGFDRT